MMNTKIEVGRENIYFEMESKQEDNAETYDSVVFRKNTPQTKPNVETGSRIKILMQWSITHYSLWHLPSLLLRS